MSIFNKRRVILLVSFLILHVVAAVSAEVGKGQMGAGLLIQGLSLRGFLSDRTSLEFRAQHQSEDDISVFGLRGYRYFNGNSSLPIFLGVEADAVTFKNDRVEGGGFVVELFMGGEYFFAPRLSFQMDMGPAFVHISDDNKNSFQNTDPESGLEFVVNFGLNWYFRGRR